MIVVKAPLKPGITTVAPLTENQVNGIKKRLDKLTGKKVEIEVVHDPADSGRSYDSSRRLTMVDGSIAGRLKSQDKTVGIAVTVHRRKRFDKITR